MDFYGSGVPNYYNGDQQGSYGGIAPIIHFNFPRFTAV